LPCKHALGLLLLWSAGGVASAAYGRPRWTNDIDVFWDLGASDSGQYVEVLVDPHVTARGMVEEFDHPLVGRFKGLRVPFRFEGFDDPVMHRPPLLGEHTDAVLQDRLGLTNEQVATLRAQSAI